MKLILKAIRIMFLFVLGSLGAILLTALLFIFLSPQFGGKHRKEDLLRYAESSQFRKGIFHNTQPSSVLMGAKDTWKVTKEYLSGGVGRAPEKPLAVERVDSLEIVSTQGPSLIWFGHSSFLLKLEGKSILIDPMFGDVPSPVSFLGQKRFTDGLPIEIESLPEIDVVLLSHDHYDHLDHGSIVRLINKTKQFYVPLGVGAHLRAWGVPAERITEADWWDTFTFDSITFVSAPARHFSGRGLFDRFSTLWCSWVIKSGSSNLFFSGDSGYGDHFAEIGEKYGPFDFAMMECGQYNEMWRDIHMMPEETAQAAVDVRALQFMPIHWGAFVLALHSWDDPVKRVTQKAMELGIPVNVPKIGEWIDIKSLPVDQVKWYE